MLKDEEDRIISRSKELLGRDRLDALEGRGRSSRIQEEVQATDNALKALQTSLSVPSNSRLQTRNIEPFDKASFSLPPVVRTPRSVTGDQAVVSNQDSSAGPAIPKESLPESAPQSFLSKEAQLRIAQICVVHGAGVENEKPISVTADDESESVILWAARCNSSGINLDKTPFRELVSASVSERRDMAPHISTIYDQIFLNPEVETLDETQNTSIAWQPGTTSAVGGPPSMFYGRDDRKSSHAPSAWRTEEGFWVDFKSVDLGHAEVRGTPSHRVRTYGSVSADRPEEPSFLVRSLEQVKVAVLALAMVVAASSSGGAWSA
eukprot:CAMPEP_0172186258 /NCGR_PEP_ID=MMETSP1050-20130122/20655_1 /TAXON_ID=233186 /ORGANISM="Cryptomonas curvata, Strain CCAP979/52" /LENGTH=320 /DNA_ID=CAMNT_0012860395 /DNA_START=75 /DNA_END=1038 /DNA_ORIENTATION=+